MRKKDFTGRNKPRTARSRSQGRADWPGYDAVRDRDGFRSRRLASARQEKRGRRTRLIFMVGIITAAAVFVSVFLIIRAGSGDEVVVLEPAIIDDPGSGNVILMEKDENGRLSELLVLAGAGQGGYGLMTIPARTVVQTPAAGFQRLDNLYESNGQAQIDQALADLLQVPIRYHVSFSHDALGAALEQAGVINFRTDQELTIGQNSGGSTLTLSPGDNSIAPAQAATLIQAANGDRRDGPKVQAIFFLALHDALMAKPESDRKRLATELLTKIQTDMDGGDFTDLFLTVTAPGRSFAVSPLPVRAAGAGSSWYFEPAMDKLGPLTGNFGPDAAMQLEIRNGTELAGIVEAAATRLEKLQFPTTLTPDPSGVNYEITQIRCGSDAVSAGNQVRDLLGGGNVIKDESMEKQQIIVIIGKDLSVALTGQS